MTKYNIPKSYGVVIIFLLLSIVMVGQSSRKKSHHEAKRQEYLIKPIERVEDLKITNKTSAFNIVGIKKISDESFEITFRNEYNKSITGFEVSIADMRIQTELIVGGDEQQFILPGGIYQKMYAAQAGLEKYGIQILAVLFDDGSSDGDIKYIKEVTDYRLGMKLERERVLPLLEAVENSKPQNTLTALAELETHMSTNISSVQQENRLDNVGLGIRNERRRILDEIRILKDKQQTVQSSGGNTFQTKEDLMIIKRMYENIIRLASQSLKAQKEQ